MIGRASKLLAILFALALVAAACGGGDDEESTDVTTAVDDAEQQQVEADREEGEATGADSSAEAAGEAVRGGKLVYGIEADSANPWTHYATSCAISCRMIFRAITDGLFVTDTNGEIQPYLVESVEPNDDFTEWTMTIKDGITFHDGTPLDGEAVKYNIDTCRFSPLTGPAFFGLADVTASGQTVTMIYEAPEALGPRSLRTEVCGMMFSPEWMKTLANNPLNAAPFVTEEEAAALDLSGDPAAPVGVGAFKYVSYTPGNGNSFVAERNPDYWRGDGPNSLTGEGLPYLDEVEFVVAVDIQGRSNGLKAGQFDIIHTANADEIAKYEGDTEFKLLQANDFGETSYFLINAAEGENGVLAAVRGVDSLAMDPGDLNATNPMVHVSCRRAFAHAIDRDRVAAERGAGIVTPANGPFPPGSVGYLEDSGYPDFDLDAAAAEFETCKADHGTVPVAFTFNTTNDAFNVETNELVASMWTDAFGDEIDVSITPIEQGQYIGLALAGTFQVQGWRNHAGVDPTEQWFWWNQATASPIDPGVPELALNFGRFQDPAMDEAFVTIRQNPDPAARQAAAEEVNRLFGENVWNFWTTWTLWGVMSNPRVQNITDLEIPDFGPAMPVIAGKHHLTQMWCIEGNCQG
ncbi:MAG: ABC transporter substrate-binding protein [Acidimicrobiia bacterium]|nr:ABC transporter substrate-binding protein [Acidimicrobiia bacterium]